MSTFRKTVLTTAIIGAGLAATSGSAFASDHTESHDSKSASSGCSNLVQGKNSNGAGDAKRSDIVGGDQELGASNVCDNFSGNKVLSGNNIALGGNVQNGDSKTVTNSESTSIVKSLTSIVDLGM